MFQLNGETVVSYAHICMHTPMHAPLTLLKGWSLFPDAEKDAWNMLIAEVNGRVQQDNDARREQRQRLREAAQKEEEEADRDKTELERGLRALANPNYPAALHARFIFGTLFTLTPSLRESIIGSREVLQAVLFPNQRCVCVC